MGGRPAGSWRSSSTRPATRRCSRCCDGGPHRPLQLEAAGPLGPARRGHPAEVAHHPRHLARLVQRAGRAARRAGWPARPRAAPGRPGPTTLVSGSLRPAATPAESEPTRGEPAAPGDLILGHLELGALLLDPGLQLGVPAADLGVAAPDLGRHVGEGAGQGAELVLAGGRQRRVEAPLGERGRGGGEAAHRPGQGAGEDGAQAEGDGQRDRAPEPGLALHPPGRPVGLVGRLGHQHAPAQAAHRREAGQPGPPVGPRHLADHRGPGRRRRRPAGPARRPRGSAASLPAMRSPAAVHQERRAVAGRLAHAGRPARPARARPPAPARPPVGPHRQRHPRRRLARRAVDRPDGQAGLPRRLEGHGRGRRPPARPRPPARGRPGRDRARGGARRPGWRGGRRPCRGAPAPGARAPGGRGSPGPGPASARVSFVEGEVAGGLLEGAQPVEGVLLALPGQAGRLPGQRAAHRGGELLRGRTNGE